MIRRAVVHVGLEKTGSTALQAWLHRERDALFRAGIYLPRSPGAPNHTRLAAACLDDGVIDNLKAHYLSQQRLGEAEWRAGIRSAFDVEMAQARGWSLLVISTELISSRLHTETEMARLCEWLYRHVDRLHFVIYLRRQDELAVSRFSSALRAGHAGFDDIWSDLSANSFLKLPAGRNAEDAREFFDYRRILSRFALPGDPELTVRAYRRDIDIVADFRELLGLPPTSSPDPTPRTNTAMSAAAQYLVGQLNRENRVLWPNGARNEPYRALLRRIESEVKGPPRRVPRAEASAFLERFAQGNCEVERRWFPDGLFDDDVSQWPETVDYGSLVADMAPVLARYRAEAAALPRAEPAAPTIKRVWHGLRLRVGR
jgi:hypothetical protein